MLSFILPAARPLGILKRLKLDKVPVGFRMGGPTPMLRVTFGADIFRMTWNTKRKMMERPVDFRDGGHDIQIRDFVRPRSTATTQFSAPKNWHMVKALYRMVFQPRVSGSEPQF